MVAYNPNVHSDYILITFWNQLSSATNFSIDSSTCSSANVAASFRRHFPFSCSGHGSSSFGSGCTGSGGSGSLIEAGLHIFPPADLNMGGSGSGSGSVPDDVPPPKFTHNWVASLRPKQQQTPPQHPSLQCHYESQSRLKNLQLIEQKHQRRQPHHSSPSSGQVATWHTLTTSQPASPSHSVSPGAYSPEQCLLTTAQMPPASSSFRRSTCHTTSPDPWPHPQQTDLLIRQSQKRNCLSKHFSSLASARSSLFFHRIPFFSSILLHQDHRQRHPLKFASKYEPPLCLDSTDQKGD
ncbi:unnamed protein product [Protopolystoma xenopodis]|uniref:Uncharacterized protein n=1 Tax=Protopolystoma xenopodis TaxID=117903 RepID=A0A3S5AQC0_9PLAT|nr:unnamed protein product [Protopolystoma xenopodis]